MNYNELSLRLDTLTYTELKNLLPYMSASQERIFRQVHRYWIKHFDEPRDPNDLIDSLPVNNCRGCKRICKRCTKTLFLLN